MSTGTEALQSTLRQVRTWSRSLQRLESVLEQLEALEEQPLAQALGWLIARCTDDADSATQLVPGASARTQEEQRHRQALEILVDLATTYLEDGDEGRFTGRAEDSEGLAREFLSLRHLDQDGTLPLLSGSMNRRWAEHRERVLAGNGADRLRQELALVQLARSLYALAIGYSSFPEHMALAHRVGESQLHPSFQPSSGGRLATAD